MRQFLDLQQLLFPRHSDSKAGSRARVGDTLTQKQEVELEYVGSTDIVGTVSLK